MRNGTFSNCRSNRIAFRYGAEVLPLQGKGSFFIFSTNIELLRSRFCGGNLRVKIGLLSVFNLLNDTIGVKYW